MGYLRRVQRVKPSKPPQKSRGGLMRLVHALRYSCRGIAAAWRFEAAFRQEVLIGIPLIAIAPWLAPDRGRLALMIGAFVFVWLVELINSAIEAVCDAVSGEMHPLLGRAKDMGSAAVLLSIVIASLVWAAAALV